MKTLEMEVAIMSYLNPRQNLVVPNVFWGMGFKHEIDILELTQRGYASEIEIKVSKSDLMKDKKKKHGHYSMMLKYLYFAVPEKLKEIALKEIPENAGLLVVKKREPTKWNTLSYVVDEVRKAVPRKNAHKWDEKERFKLAGLGAMRILPLKRKLLKVVNNE